MSFFFFFFYTAKFVNAEDLNDVLCEFDAVMEDFTSPTEKRHFRYDEHLKTMKRRSSASVSDSGISDSESKYVGGWKKNNNNKLRLIQWNLNFAPQTLELRVAQWIDQSLLLKGHFRPVWSLTWQSLKKGNFGQVFKNVRLQLYAMSRWICCRDQIPAGAPSSLWQSNEERPVLPLCLSLMDGHSVEGAD